MKNQKLRKVLLTVVSALLLMSLTVVGTVAYLTSTTNTVQNTFTVGNVKFDEQAGLTEAKVDEYGKPVTPDERTTVGNQYKLMPGHTYTKDPTVKIDAGSEPAYVRMLVKITDMTDVKAVLGAGFLPQNFVNGWDNTVWQTTGVIKEEGNAAIYEFWYVGTAFNTDTAKGAGIVDARNEDKELPALFEEIKIPGTVKNEDLAKLSDMDIQVVAQAIQADGFATQADAWAAAPDVTFAPTTNAGGTTEDNTPAEDETTEG